MVTPCNEETPLHFWTLLINYISNYILLQQFTITCYEFVTLQPF